MLLLSSLHRHDLRIASLVKPPHVRHPAAQGAGLILAHALRDGVHAAQVILQIIAAAKLFAVAAAVVVEALPVAAGDLVDGLFVALAVVGRREAFGSRAGREPAVVDL